MLVCMCMCVYYTISVCIYSTYTVTGICASIRPHIMRLVACNISLLYEIVDVCVYNPDMRTNSVDIFIFIYYIY